MVAEFFSENLDIFISLLATIGLVLSSRLALGLIRMYSGDPISIVQLEPFFDIEDTSKKETDEPEPCKEKSCKQESLNEDTQLKVKPQAKNCDKSTPKVEESEEENGTDCCQKNAKPKLNDVHSPTRILKRKIRIQNQLSTDINRKIEIRIENLFLKNPEKTRLTYGPMEKKAPIIFCEQNSAVVIKSERIRSNSTWTLAVELDGAIRQQQDISSTIKIGDFSYRPRGGGKRGIILQTVTSLLLVLILFFTVEIFLGDNTFRVLSMDNRLEGSRDIFLLYSAALLFSIGFAFLGNRVAKVKPKAIISGYQDEKNEMISTGAKQ